MFLCVIQAKHWLHQTNTDISKPSRHQSGFVSQLGTNKELVSCQFPFIKTPTGYQPNTHAYMFTWVCRVSLCYLVLGSPFFHLIGAPGKNQDICPVVINFLKTKKGETTHTVTKPREHLIIFLNKGKLSQAKNNRKNPAMSRRPGASRSWKLSTICEAWPGWSSRPGGKGPTGCGSDNNLLEAMYGHGFASPPLPSR